MITLSLRYSQKMTHMDPITIRYLFYDSFLMTNPLLVTRTIAPQTAFKDLYRHMTSSIMLLRNDYAMIT